MSDRKQAERIIFQTKKHHRQVLRSQIDPSLIDKIEIDRNPSLNYRKAYKSLCNDQLQKTVQMMQEKKQKTRQLTKHDPYLFTVGMKQNKLPMIDRTNMSASQLVNYGKRFIDYDQQRTLKYQNHVVKNYDGGQSFFKAHDQHLQKKNFEAKITNKTLNNQLKLKQYIKTKQLQKVKQQNKAFQQLKNRQLQQDQQRLQNEKYQKQAFRQDIVRQIQQQKQRKQMKSKFQYQNISRHNPITNPIQYHTDNPYILKEIQTRNLFKSQSLHQFPRG